MGVDDDRDCPDHDWQPFNIHLGTDGAHIDHECTKCGAVMTQTPGELTGRSG